MFGGIWVIITFSEACCQGIRTNILFLEPVILPCFRLIDDYCSPGQFCVTKSVRATGQDTSDLYHLFSSLSTLFLLSLRRTQEKRSRKSGDKNVRHEISVVLTLSAFACKAHLDRVVFEYVQGNMTNNSEIFSNIVRSDLAIVLVENNIETPVNRFNTPVGAYRFGK